jgi:hypothetical protein
VLTKELKMECVLLETDSAGVVVEEIREMLRSFGDRTVK